jgi:hypothetical protein
MKLKIDEKILREAIRKEIASQIISEALTVGDFREALKFVKGKTRDEAQKAALKAGAKKAVLTALSFFPGGGPAAEAIGFAADLASGASDAGSTVASLYKSLGKAPEPKEKKPSELWDYINLDDSVSKIIADDVESKFLKDLEAKMRQLDDADPLPNVDDQFQNWLKQTYDRNIVKK